MRILVIGAAGRTGRLVVERALGHGHEVTALVRTKPLDISHPRLEVASGDAAEFETVDAVMRGHHAVAIAAGRSSSPGGGSLEAIAAATIHSMASQGVSRLAALSAAGAFARTDPGLSMGFRAMIATVLRGTYDDLEAMERRIMASALDWTIVRPVGLSDEPATGHYRVSLDGSIPSKVSRISRADVAAVVVKALETDTYLRRTVVVAQ